MKKYKELKHVSERSLRGDFVSDEFSIDGKCVEIVFETLKKNKYSKQKKK